MSLTSATHRRLEIKTEFLPCAMRDLLSIQRGRNSPAQLEELGALWNDEAAPETVDVGACRLTGRSVPRIAKVYMRSA